MKMQTFLAKYKYQQPCNFEHTYTFHSCMNDHSYVNSHETELTSFHCSKLEEHCRGGLLITI